jgi:hypothetical protein
MLGSNQRPPPCRDGKARSSRDRIGHGKPLYAGDSEVRPDLRLRRDTAHFEPEGRTEDALIGCQQPSRGPARGHEPSGPRRASAGLVPRRLFLLGQPPHRLGTADLMQLREVAPAIDGTVALSRTESALGLPLAPVGGALQELFLRGYNSESVLPAAGVLETLATRRACGLWEHLPDQLGTSRDPHRAQRGRWREPASAGGHRPRG